MAIRQRRRSRIAIVASDSSLAVLAGDLSRCRTRAHRLWRDYQAADEKAGPATSITAHQVWSNAVDEALEIAGAISRQRARDLAELANQFEALWWWIVEDDSILDGSARRWLRRFRQSLHELAAAAHEKS